MKKDKVLSYYNELLSADVYYFECSNCSERTVLEENIKDVLCSCGRPIVNADSEYNKKEVLHRGTLMSYDSEGNLVPAKLGDNAVGFLDSISEGKAIVVTGVRIGSPIRIGSSTEVKIIPSPMEYITGKLG